MEQGRIQDFNLGGVNRGPKGRERGLGFLGRDSQPPPTS